MSRQLKKAVSVLLCGILVWTSGDLAQATLYAPQVLAKPALLPQYELTPPQALGRLTDYHNAPGSKLVILIQDLHANYEVQRNIASLLEFLAQKLGSAESSVLSPESNRKSSLSTQHSALSTIPFALAVEGASGPIDSSVMALFPDDTVKEQTCDYLMKQGELTGMEYFAVKRKQPSLLVGVEDPNAYSVNRELFRKTYVTRQQLVGYLTGMKADLTDLRYRLYSHKLRNFQKQINAFDQGTLSTEDYVAYLGTQARLFGIQLAKEFPTLEAWQPRGSDATASGGSDPRRLAKRLSNIWGQAPQQVPDPSQLRQMTAAFLKSTQRFLSQEDRQTFSTLAKQSDNGSYYLYLRDYIYAHKLFAEVPPVWTV